MDIDELFGCASARKGAARLPGPATPGGVHGAVAPLSIDDLFSPCARLPTATPAGPHGAAGSSGAAGGRKHQRRFSEDDDEIQLPCSPAEPN